MKTLTLQLTKVKFDFDDAFGKLPVKQQKSVIESVVGDIFEVEVEDNSNDAEIADALVEEVSYCTGWCVISLDFVHVLNTHW